MIIGALAIVRFLKGAGAPPYGIDASYYYQLARHIMRGEGFVTTVSLYHEGWVLPAKTPIYPLWPFVLGYSGRVIGLERAADLLPRLFYLLDLVLLYVLGRGVALRAGALRITERWWIPDAGHWMVLIFGLAPRFFGATTHPYTEGLAFAMALSSFVALERFERTRGIGAAAVSGLFAGLAFLARTQMVGVAVGCFVALAWFAIRRGPSPAASRHPLPASGARGDAGGGPSPRRRGEGGRRPDEGLALVAWSLVALATIAPWLFFIGYIPGVTAMSMPRVQLPRFIAWTEQPTRSAWIAQRIGSLGIMFDPRNPYSYVQSFGIVAYLVPLAAIAALLELVRRKRVLVRPSLLVTAVFIAGLFFFFNLMLYHSDVWMPWLFGWRHGLPYIFLIALAVPWLAARSPRFGLFIAAFLLVSVFTSARNVAAFVQAPDPQLSAGETQLVQWLESQPKPASAIATNAQILGSMTDARLYWTWCEAGGNTTQAMLRMMPIDYVLLGEQETRCRFAAEAGPMRVVKAFGEPGRRMFVLKPMQR